MKKWILALSACFTIVTTDAQAEQTLAIIKPDAVKAHHIGDIVSQYEKSNLKVIGLKLVKLTPQQAKEFYKEHEERPFYGDLVNFMTSGPVVVIALDGDKAVEQNRKMIGSTNPAEAESGTLRKQFGASKSENAVHGSDSQESAKRELAFFFQPEELVLLP